MIIGIDGSRAFLKRRTGIEEYSYQVIKHLRDDVPGEHQVILYVRKKIAFQDGRLRLTFPDTDFSLPKNWRVRGVWAPRFWTQIGLSLEMLIRRPDTLFIPAHTVPIIHPKRTMVTIHGLEYEFCKSSYSLWERIYMRASIRFSCRAAQAVICVSENTKRDVMRLYGVPEEKIEVILEGYKRTTNQESGITNQMKMPYLLFIGRLEERKNIIRMIEAFEILKEKYQIPHQLVLIGKPGYGYEKIRAKIESSKVKEDIMELGYVSEEEKWQYLRSAAVFLFPTLYEGFGIPVLEAQSVGVPVVTSNISSLPEVGGQGAVYVDPLDSEDIARGASSVLFHPEERDTIIEKGRVNVVRFSWENCAKDISLLLTDEDHVLLSLEKK